MKTLGYSLQGNRKTLEVSRYVDRDARFRHIAETVKGAITAGQPAIFVDTKKQERAPSEGWLGQRETVSPGWKAEPPFLGRKPHELPKSDRCG